MVVASLLALVTAMNNITHGNGCHFVKWPPKTSKWLIPSTDIYYTILFLQVYTTQNLDVESRLKAQYILVSRIDVLLWKWPPSFLNRIQNGGYNGMVYSEILFLKSTPHKI